MIKSISYDQHEIIRNIINLHCPDGIECDLTYGNGSFYKEFIPRPPLCYDIQPLYDFVKEGDSTNINQLDDSIKSIMVDPPFLTYIKKGREHNSIMGKRFSGYYTYEELSFHYHSTLKEVERVLKKGGVLIFKCQDIIHNHKFLCTHLNVITWALQCNLKLIDLFVLCAKNRIPIYTVKTQQHARVFHSYFLVFKKGKL